MLFSEIYSRYYKAVSKIVSEALRGELSDKTMKKIVRENAFAESGIDIPSSLKSGRWPLLLSDNTTVLTDESTLPLTTLEKRFMKSLLDDPRAKLFDISDEGLEDTEPLFSPDVFVKFDVFSDGDPYDSANYVDNFRKILFASKHKRLIKISFTDRKGVERECTCNVDNLEYSSKNDRFRAITSSESGNVTINLSSVTKCEVLELSSESSGFALNRVKKELVAELSDCYNALQRAMISFSWLEKETSKIDDTHYRLTLRYYEEDEAEILIQILSFGTNLRVVSPQTFVEKIKNKIISQDKLRAVF